MNYIILSGYSRQWLADGEKHSVYEDTDGSLTGIVDALLISKVWNSFMFVPLKFFEGQDSLTL